LLAKEKIENKLLLTYLSVIIPCTPGAHGWKLKSGYGIASRCYRDYSICITTGNEIDESKKHKINVSYFAGQNY
jgi:hypothetical protein